MTYRGGVRRWYLSRRWLVLHGVALVTLAACARLGWWQLERSMALHEASQRPIPAGAPVPVSDVLPVTGLLPQDDVARRVRAVGRYDAVHQLLVRDRPLHGRPGYLVLTPLRPPGTGQPAIAVARGWVPAPADGSLPTPPPPPAGQVTITGWAAGDDPVADGPQAVARPGEITAVNPAVLVNAIPYPVRAGYVHVSASSPPEHSALTLVPRPTLRTQGSWPLQNLTYVAEWWAFGGAAIWFWIVWLRQDAAAHRAAAGPTARAGAEGPPLVPDGEPSLTPGPPA